MSRDKATEATVVVTVVLAHEEGPKADADEIAEAFAEEIEGMGAVWADDAGYAVTVISHSVEAAS